MSEELGSLVPPGLGSQVFMQEKVSLPECERQRPELGFLKIQACVCMCVSMRVCVVCVDSGQGLIFG